MAEKTNNIMDDINITIDPKLAKFAAECGPEAFKNYLDFVDKQAETKAKLMSQQLDIEKAEIERNTKFIEFENNRLAYEASNREAFYNTLSNMFSDIIDYVSFNNMNKNK